MIVHFPISWSKQERTIFLTAERSERAENFLFRATREHTEASIYQVTVAMRCHGANSQELRRRAVPRSDTSALRAADTSALRAADTSALRTADQQLYNRTALTSWAHRGSLSKQRELVLSSLPTPPPFFFADSRPPVHKVACLISLCLLSTCMYHTFSHISFLGYKHMHPQSIRFPRLTAIRTHIIRWHMCLGGGSFPVTIHGFSSWLVAAVRARRLFPSTISGERGSVPVLPVGRKLDGQPVLSQGLAPSSLAAAHSFSMCTLFCAFNTCVSCITFFLGLAASHSSKDPPSLAYWLFASPHWTVCAGVVGVALSATRKFLDKSLEAPCKRREPQGFKNCPVHHALNLQDQNDQKFNQTFPKIQFLIKALPMFMFSFLPTNSWQHFKHLMILKYCLVTDGNCNKIHFNMYISVNTLIERLWNLLHGSVTLRCHLKTFTEWNVTCACVQAWVCVAMEKGARWLTSTTSVASDTCEHSSMKTARAASVRVPFLWVSYFQPL